MEENTEDVQVLMPKLGSGMIGTIGRWRKRDGDLVGNGEIIAEIVTDKVTIEVESPASGVLLRRLSLGVGALMTLLSILALVFFIRRNQQAAFSFLIAAFVLIAAFEVFRFFASFVLWLKKRRAQSVSLE